MERANRRRRTEIGIYHIGIALTAKKEAGDQSPLGKHPPLVRSKPCRLAARWRAAEEEVVNQVNNVTYVDFSVQVHVSGHRRIRRRTH
jgi:DNA-binding IscR family transcriptional regulator